MQKGTCWYGMGDFVVRFPIAIRKQDVQEVQEVQQDVDTEESVNQWITAVGAHKCNLLLLQALCSFQRLVNKPDDLNFEFRASSTDSLFIVFRPTALWAQEIANHHKTNQKVSLAKAVCDGR